MATSKLVIGSAQFGSDYGVANQVGRVPANVVEDILDYAYESGVATIDTAPVYGASESVIGRFNDNRFKIITKVPAIDVAAKKPSDFVCRSFETSLKNLKTERVDALLFHHADDLLGVHGDEVYRAVQDLKAQGLIKKVGASVYSPEMSKQLLKKYELDLLQFPFNVFDQRFAKDNYLQILKNQSIELHARSIFLQGLLLMDSMQLPEFFEPIRTSINLLHDFSNRQLSKLKAALIHFVLNINEIDKLVMGCDSLNQFKELVDLFNSGVDANLDKLQAFSCDMNDMIDPRRWVSL